MAHFICKSWAEIILKHLRDFVRKHRNTVSCDTFAMMPPCAQNHREINASVCLIFISLCPTPRHKETIALNVAYNITYIVNLIVFAVYISINFRKQTHNPDKQSEDYRNEKLSKTGKLVT